MGDTGERDKLGKFKPGHIGIGGRKPKLMPSDVEGFLLDVLDMKGARMLADALEATKPFGQHADVERPDWPMRIRAYEVIRDTVRGKPAQVITGDGGGPLLAAIMTDTIEAMKKLVGDG